MRVLGIDPGLSGGFAIVDDDVKLVEAGRMPIIEAGREKFPDPALLLDLIEQHRPDFIWIEKAQARGRPQEQGEHKGRGGLGSGQVLQIGIGWGALLSTLVLSNTPFDVVTAQAWKARARLPAGTRKEAKKAALALARQRFGYPEQFKREGDDGPAEASLIAIYGGPVKTREAA